MIVGLIKKHEEIKLDWDYGTGSDTVKKKKIKDYLRYTTPEEREEIKKFIEELEKKEKTTIEKDNGILN